MGTTYTTYNPFMEKFAMASTLWCPESLELLGALN